jgi:hypothetical protein
VVRRSALAPSPGKFDEVLVLIEGARSRAYQAVNKELVGLYWQLGEYISRKIASAEWGDGVVEELAVAIAREYPGLRGYTRRNLFRMRQFNEAYRDHEKVSPLVTRLCRRVRSQSHAVPHARGRVPDDVAAQGAPAPEAPRALLAARARRRGRSAS